MKEVLTVNRGTVFSWTWNFSLFCTFAFLAIPDQHCFFWYDVFAVGVVFATILKIIQEGTSFVVRNVFFSLSNSISHSLQISKWDKQVMGAVYCVLHAFQKQAKVGR